METKLQHVIVKDFSALSFDNLEITVAASSEPRASRSRLAPESAGDFNVHSDGPPDAGSARSPGHEPGGALSTFASEPRAPRVLVVDDERNIRESLAKVLRAEGYVVCLAENGADALALYEVEPPDVVLLDLNMPVRNGWDALDQMIELNPRQAIIIITGRSPQLSWAGAMGTGTLIEKPIDMAELLACIRRMLAEPESQREKRVQVQRTLTRLTRPLTNLRLYGPGYPRGGINE